MTTQNARVVLCPVVYYRALWCVVCGVLLLLPFLQDLFNLQLLPKEINTAKGKAWDYILGVAAHFPGLKLPDGAGGAAAAAEGGLLRWRLRKEFSAYLRRAEQRRTRAVAMQQKKSAASLLL